MKMLLALLTLLLAGFAFPTSGRAQQPRTASEWVALCDSRSENRQFDFWLGTWDVYEGGEKVAESRIERLAGSCAILETYSQPDGYSGKSINFFDATLGKWRQIWVDEVGTVSEFAGAVKERMMRFEGRTHTRDGKEILRKMEVSAGDADSVRQYSERSDDGGRSWSVAYDLHYRRHAPEASTR